MPDELKDWLYSASKKNNRSASSEIMFRLRNSLNTQYTKDQITHFNEASPTEINGEGYGVRFDTELKEAIRNYGKLSGNSLNQEMVMRLFYAEKESTSEVVTIREDAAAYSDEDKSVIELFNALDDKSKHAVMALIRNLTG